MPCFEANVILGGPKETGDLIKQEAYCFLCSVLLAAEGWSNNGQEGHQCHTLSRCSLAARCTESIIDDLPVIVTILFQCTVKEFQFSWKAFVITDGSC
jgi:hypothetical protein